MGEPFPSHQCSDDKKATADTQGQASVAWMGLPRLASVKLLESDIEGQLHMDPCHGIRSRKGVRSWRPSLLLNMPHPRPCLALLVLFCFWPQTRSASWMHPGVLLRGRDAVRSLNGHPKDFRMCLALLIFTKTQKCPCSTSPTLKYL